MDLDISSESTGGAVAYGGADGVPTTVGNVSLSVDSTDRLYGESTPKDLVLETDNTIPGYLTGRRPAYGHQYPRSEHTPAIDLRGYFSDPPNILTGITGYIFSTVSYTQTPTTTSLDPDDTSAGTYMDNFGMILPYQPDPPLFGYNETRGPVSIESGVFDYFSTDWVLLFSAYNACWNGDYCDVTIEFLDQVDSVIAVIQTDKDGWYRHQVNYGTSLNNLSKSNQVGDYPNTTGEITFTSDSIIYTNIRSTNYNDSFTINCPAYLIKKIRISNLYVDSSWTGGLCSAGVQLKIV